jgi:two-component system response regulator
MYWLIWYLGLYALIILWFMLVICCGFTRGTFMVGKEDVALPQKHLVLLVEDNQDDVELTLRAIKHHNLTQEVVVAKNGVEALDFLFARGAYAGRDTTDLPQVVLLDINLPLVNGFEVLKQIRGNSTTQLVPVVMLSTSAEPRDVEDSYTLRANSYVRKLVNFTDFTQAVGDVAQYWLTLNEPPVPVSLS